MSVTGAVPAREETNFYSDNGVRVTNARIIIGQTTYAMLNVTSVMTAEERPSKLGAIVTLVIGGLMFVSGLKNTPGIALLGVLMLGVGGLWLKGLKTKYHLRISSASGEANAVTDTNKQRIDSIVQAVNEAIIGRG
jgi:hypothetical protein